MKRGITEQDVREAIVSEHYFTAADGLIGAEVRDLMAGPGELMPATAETRRELGLLTICILVLRNGWKIVGTSACTDAARFDANLGRRYAHGDAVRQVWPLLGYQLKTAQAEGGA